MAQTQNISPSGAISGGFQGFALPKDAIYLRVSTKTQMERNSIDTQRMKVAGRGIVGVEFTEQESGKKDNRPELKRAISYVRGTGGVLYVASLNRMRGRVAELEEAVEMYQHQMREMIDERINVIGEDMRGKKEE